MDMTETKRLHKELDTKIGFIHTLNRQIEVLSMANHRLATSNEQLRDANKALHRELADLLSDSSPLKTFAVTSQTNYGPLVHIINAENETTARAIADNAKEVWDGYTIQEVLRQKTGIVFVNDMD